MEAYSVLRDLCIIIVFGKAFGILARKLRAPQVVGEIIAGLVIGPCVLGIVQQTDFLSVMAEIGVILLMFSAGLETSIQDLKRTGIIAFLIACAGVLVPLIGGTLLYEAFYGFSPWGSENFLKAMMIGCIITATSVSITVRALQELGHLKGIVGTTIMSAAIIDDVIGIIVLTVVLGFKDPSANIGRTCLMTALFFVLALILGYAIFRIFKAFDEHYLHTRRVPILGLALCMFMAYVAERYFGVADITGAYLAGIILSSIKDADYIAEKMDINSYMLFGPIFFASIGLKTNITGLTPAILIFCVCFVLVAMVTKIIGCGLMAKVFHFHWNESLKIGVGMMTRGEVALIVAQKGLAVGLLDSTYFTAVILLIVCSSILTPVLLKLLYARYPDNTEHLEGRYSNEPTQQNT